MTSLRFIPTGILTEEPDRAGLSALSPCLQEKQQVNSTSKVTTSLRKNMGSRLFIFRVQVGAAQADQLAFQAGIVTAAAFAQQVKPGR